jgi:hypothetical protein
MSYVPVLVCLAPIDPDNVEDAVDEALAPFAFFVDEQWFERPNWSDELVEPTDGAAPGSAASISHHRMYRAAPGAIADYLAPRARPGRPPLLRAHR